MPISSDDRLAIHELLSLHGHLCDDGRSSDLHLFLTEDAAYDVTEFGLGVVQGLPSLRLLWETNAVEQPLGHHVTNVIVSEGSDAVVRARSKGLAVMANGNATSVVYDDILEKTDRGWRLARRKISARRREPSTGVKGEPSQGK